MSFVPDSTDPARMQRHHARNRRGMTFVEIVVMVSFVGIVAALVVYAFNGAQKAQPSTACAVDAQNVRNAETGFHAAHGVYTDEATLVRDGDLASQSALHNVITDGQTYTVISAGACSTQVLTDGFEPPAVSPVQPGGSYTQTQPASLGAWSVVSGTVSVVSTSKWNFPSSGLQALELSGKGTYGAIQRTVSGLVPGNTYTLRFDYALGTCGPKAGLRVQVGDLDTTLNVTNPAAKEFLTATQSFTARQGVQQLTFSGAGSTPSCGALVDDVTVTT
jgi:Tfp pilus assembly protein PilE